MWWITGWDGGKHNAAYALIEAAKQRSIDGAIGGIRVQAFVVGRLDAGFDGVERVDEKINGESCKCTSEKDISISVVEGHCTSAACARRRRINKTTLLIATSYREISKGVIEVSYTFGTL